MTGEDEQNQLTPHSHNINIYTITTGLWMFNDCIVSGGIAAAVSDSRMFTLYVECIRIIDFHGFHNTKTLSTLLKIVVCATAIYIHIVHYTMSNSKRCMSQTTTQQCLTQMQFITYKIVWFVWISCVLKS